MFLIQSLANGISDRRSSALTSYRSSLKGAEAVDRAASHGQ